jgi:hypothetical protein
MTAMRELETTERQSGSAVQERWELRELPAAELARVEGGNASTLCSILCTMCVGGAIPVKTN